MQDGVPLQPKENMLTMDEIVRVANLFVRNGVRKIRLTGGEPTLRKDLAGEDGGMGIVSFSRCTMHILLTYPPVIKPAWLRCLASNRSE
jgi:hypothetical protein